VRVQTDLSQFAEDRADQLGVLVVRDLHALVLRGAATGPGEVVADLPEEVAALVDEVAVLLFWGCKGSYKRTRVRLEDLNDVEEEGHHREVELAKVLADKQLDDLQSREEILLVCFAGDELEDLEEALPALLADELASVLEDREHAVEDELLVSDVTALGDLLPGLEERLLEVRGRPGGEDFKAGHQLVLPVLVGLRDPEEGLDDEHTEEFDSKQAERFVLRASETDHTVRIEPPVDGEAIKVHRGDLDGPLDREEALVVLPALL